jgi:hypothetical protein
VDILVIVPEVLPDPGFAMAVLSMVDLFRRVEVLTLFSKIRHVALPLIETGGKLAGGS